MLRTHNYVILWLSVFLIPHTIFADIIATDDYESYSPGPNNLLGQPVGGFGFQAIGSLRPPQ